MPLAASGYITRAAIFVAALAALFALVHPRASEATSGGCQQIGQGAQMIVTADPGDVNRMAAGYRPSDDLLRVRDRATPFDFFGCTGPWVQLALVLGDRSDSARMDAADQVLRADGYGPVLGGIDVSVRGQEGPDKLVGHNGHDTFRGGQGSDHLSGLRRADLLSGGAGNDLVNGGAKSDLLRGEKGNDLIKAVDGSPDIVRCGRGNDVARVDAEDTVRACESVDVA